MFNILCQYFTHNCIFVINFVIAWGSVGMLGICAHIMVSSCFLHTGRIQHQWIWLTGNANRYRSPHLNVFRREKAPKFPTFAWSNCRTYTCNISLYSWRQVGQASITPPNIWGVVFCLQVWLMFSEVALTRSVCSYSHLRENTSACWLSFSKKINV